MEERRCEDDVVCLVELEFAVLGQLRLSSAPTWALIVTSRCQLLSSANAGICMYHGTSLGALIHRANAGTSYMLRHIIHANPL